MRLVVVFFLSVLWVSAAAAQERLIQVDGVGEVQVTPDMATVTLGVNHQAGTAEAAMAAVSRDAREIFERLTVFGIDEGDIRTSGLSLNQMYEQRSSSNAPPKVIGFSASTQVTVISHDLDRVGALLDQLVKAGANSINGIFFGISDPTAAMRAARRAAVEDALDKAALYASAAGVALGDVVGITESGATPFRGPMMRAEAMMADAVPIAPGTETISARISLTIEIAGD